MKTMKIRSKVSRFVGDWDSRTFKDLVLHYDVISNSEQGHFYLQDCYPLQFMNDEQVQTNIKRMPSNGTHLSSILRE